MATGLAQLRIPVILPHVGLFRMIQIIQAGQLVWAIEWSAPPAPDWLTDVASDVVVPAPLDSGTEKMNTGKRPAQTGK